MSGVKNALIYLSIIIIENMLLPKTIEKFNIVILSKQKEDRMFFLHTLFSLMNEIFTELFPLKINKLIIIDEKNEELETFNEVLQKITKKIIYYQSV